MGTNHKGRSWPSQQGQTGVRESEAELRSVRRRLAPPPAAPQAGPGSPDFCTTGLQISARRGSKSPPARVCFSNSHRRKCLSPSEHHAVARSGRLGFPELRRPPCNSTQCACRCHPEELGSGTSEQCRRSGCENKLSFASDPGTSLVSPTGSHETAAGLLSCKPGRPQTHPGHLCCPGLLEGRCLALMSQPPQETVLSVTKASIECRGAWPGGQGPLRPVSPRLCGGLRRPRAAQGSTAASALRGSEQAIQPHASTGPSPRIQAHYHPWGCPWPGPVSVVYKEIPTLQRIGTQQ